MDRSSLLARLVDVHSHIADRPSGPVPLTGQICLMASTLTTQAMVQAYPDPEQGGGKFIRGYGVHPWWTHQLSLLPATTTKQEHYISVFECTVVEIEPYLPFLPHPTSLNEFITDVRTRLVNDSSAIVGEVGLDKSFKLPSPTQLANPPLNLPSSSTTCTCCHPPSSPSTSFIPLRTSISHQISILRAQISLAIELNRPISMHNVKASSHFIELFRRVKEEEQEWETIKVCLHSFGGSAESATRLQKENSNLFFSFSALISLRSPLPKFESLVRSIQEDRILLETDSCNAAKVDDLMIEIFNLVGKVRGWEEGEMIEKLAKNWREFYDG